MLKNKNLNIIFNSSKLGFIVFIFIFFLFLVLDKPIEYKRYIDINQFTFYLFFLLPSSLLVSCQVIFFYWEFPRVIKYHKLLFGFIATYLIFFMFSEYLQDLFSYLYEKTPGSWWRRISASKHFMIALFEFLGIYFLTETVKNSNLKLIRIFNSKHSKKIFGIIIIFIMSYTCGKIITWFYYSLLAEGQLHIFPPRIIISKKLGFYWLTNPAIPALTFSMILGSIYPSAYSLGAILGYALAWSNGWLKKPPLVFLAIFSAIISLGVKYKTLSLSILWIKVSSEYFWYNLQMPYLSCALIPVILYIIPESYQRCGDSPQNNKVFYRFNKKRGKTILYIFIFFILVIFPITQARYIDYENVESADYVDLSVDTKPVFQFLNIINQAPK